MDATELGAFYDTPLGEVVRRALGRTLADLWSDVGGLSLLGIGYATPFLPSPRGRAERVLAFMPPWQGVVRWPAEPLAATVLADPQMMPLADGAIDRVLCVHALEGAEDPAELLHEIARILSPAGRVILVCPNRRGLWARRDTTPFGHGQPFSRGQLKRLMREASLEPERWVETLYAPPLTNRLVLAGAAMWERCGATLSLPFAGLHVVEAVRRLHRPALVRGRRRSARLRPSFVPVPATRAGLGGERAASAPP